MVKRKNESGRGTLLVILVAAPILTILLAMACAKLILSESLPETAEGWSPIVIVGIVSLLLAFFAAKKANSHKLLWSLGTAGGYLMMLLFSNLIFFGNGFNGFLWISLTVLVCGFLGGVLGTGRRKKYV